MKTYLIVSKDSTMYDSYDAHVIAANNFEEVVRLAKSKAADEGAEAWSDTSIELIGSYEGTITEPFIILSSFNAG